MKYVVVANNQGFLFPILFPDQLAHSQVVENMAGVKPVSAGFVAIKGGVTIYGESESLKLKPLPGDETLITLTLGGFDSFLLLC